MNPFAPIGWLITAVYSVLATPIQWSLEQVTAGFGHVGALEAVGPFGLAVIVITLVIRGFLFPLFSWQLRTTRRTQAEQRLIAPQMKELRRKHKGDPQTLNAEMMKLYREHNISPFAMFFGCLPLLVQIPLLGGLYNGIRQATENVHHPGFLWVSDLSKSAKDAAGGSFGDVLGHPWLAVIPLLAAAATVVQSKIMMQPARDDMSDQERQMYNASRQMVLFLPVMILFMGLIFQQGIALYWVTQSAMMIAQEWYILGWGGLHVPDWFPGAGRVTPLSFSNPASTSLAALGSKAVVPKANPVRVSSGRGQKAVKRRPQEAADGALRNGRAAPAGGAPRSPAKRRTPQGSGGGRRKRGR